MFNYFLNTMYKLKEKNTSMLTISNDKVFMKCHFYLCDKKKTSFDFYYKIKHFFNLLNKRCTLVIQTNFKKYFFFIIEIKENTSF